MNRVRSREGMVAGMSPRLRPGVFVFCATPDRDAAVPGDALGSFHEAEGLSLILPRDRADALGLDYEAPMRMITLKVVSSVEGVGLTAAVSSALAEAGIAANVVAAFLHDHVFVPEDRAEEALSVLKRLQSDARTGAGGSR